MAFPSNGAAGGSETPAIQSLNAGEPALAMLLNHFGQMQQQMAEQSQQQIMWMMQMFTALHREQMGLLREELDRLRELSMEMQTVKSQLATATHVPHARPANWPSADPGPRQTVPNPAASATPKPSAQPRPASKTPPVAPAPEPEVAAKPVAPPDGSNLDPVVHDWLNDRLASLQQEHQTRWQKVMGLLGKTP